MRTDFYWQIVCAINSHSPWLRAEGRKVFVIRRYETDGCGIECAFPSLVLRSIAKEDGYKRGTRWEIPEQDLDAALARMRKKDIPFRERLRADHPKLTIADIEQLITTATHGIVNPRLGNVPE